jgi:hypothetical protein
MQAEAGAPAAGGRTSAGGPSGHLGASSRAVLACVVPALVLGALSLGSAGCSPGKAQVEDVAWEFVDAIKKQDVATLDKIIDWERYYAYGKKEAAGSGSDVDVDKEKKLLLSVLATDRVLALNYLTAHNSITDVSVSGDEAKAKVLQVDRATGEERTVTLLLHKEESGDWKVYRFSTENLDKEEG